MFNTAHVLAQVATFSRALFQVLVLDDSRDTHLPLIEGVTYSPEVVVEDNLQFDFIKTSKLLVRLLVFLFAL